MDTILTLKVQPLPQVVLQPGPFEFGNYDVGLFVEPDEDWQGLTEEGEREFGELRRRIARVIRAAEEMDAGIFPIRVGEYDIDAPRLFDGLFSRGTYFSVGVQIGGLVHDEARAPLRWALAGLAAQKEAATPGVPLKVFCVGGVLEDNLLYAANAVAEDVPGALVIIPVDYCARGDWFKHDLTNLSQNAGQIAVVLREIMKENEQEPPAGGK